MTDLYEKIISQYLKIIKDGIELEKINGYRIISLPFITSDGHLIEMQVRQLQGNYISFSDMKNEISELELSGVSITGHKKGLVKEIIREYGLELKKGEIIAYARPEQVGKVLHKMVQALLRISDLRFFHEVAPLKKEKAKEKTRKLFETRNILYQTGPQAKIKGKYEEEYQFDFIVPNEHKKAAIKTIEAETALEKTVEASAFEFDAITETPFKRIGIYDLENKWNNRLIKIAKGSTDAFIPIQEEKRIVTEVKSD